MLEKKELFLKFNSVSAGVLSNHILLIEEYTILCCCFFGVISTTETIYLEKKRLLCSFRKHWQLLERNIDISSDKLLRLVN